MRRSTVVTVLLAVLVGACRPGDQRTDTIDPEAGARVRAEMSPEVVAQLDSGSVAFRTDEYEAALEHYTRVTELAPDLGAGWFGVYMAQEALGHADEAEAALERARSVAPGASILHPDGGEAGR